MAAEEASARVWLGHLRSWRVEKGFSQARLAQRAGVTKATIVRLERKQAQANPLTVAALAKALEIPRWKLLEREPEERKEELEESEGPEGPVPKEHGGAQNTSEQRPFFLGASGGDTLRSSDIPSSA